MMASGTYPLQVCLALPKSSVYLFIFRWTFLPSEKELNNEKSAAESHIFHLYWKLRDISVHLSFEIGVLIVCGKFLRPTYVTRIFSQDGTRFSHGRYFRAFLFPCVQLDLCLSLTPNCFLE